MNKIAQNVYSIGDIVFVNEYDYEQGIGGKDHLFVIVNSDNRVVPLEYFGLIVSSHIEKSKDKSNFKYNEPLLKKSTNCLSTDSIVKCDRLYNFPKANIQFKIGSVDVDDYIRFLNAYSNFLEEIENKPVNSNS